MPKAKSKRTEEAGYAAYRDRQAKISRERSAAGRDIGKLPKVVDPRRKARCKKSLIDFLGTYFPARFPWRFSDTHVEVIQREQECEVGGGLFANAMPRGGGKSTIAEASVMHAVLYGFRKFVPIIQARQELSSQSLGKIQRELETNDLLLADFPEVCYPIRCLERISHRAHGQTYRGEPTRIKWTTDLIVLPTIKGKASSGGIVVAVPITGAVRGMSMMGPAGEILRPDMVLIDDAQTRESAKSPGQTNDREAIVTDDVVYLAGPGVKISAIMLCTVIYPGDLSDRFLDHKRHPEWQGIRTKMLRAFPSRMDLWDQYAEIRRESFRSGDKGDRADAFYVERRAEMDIGADVSWPERMKTGEASGLQSAMNIYIDNPRGFRAEYQNDPEPADGPTSLKELLPAQIITSLSGLTRYEIPREASRLVAFIDAGGGKGRGLWYTVVAFDNDFGGAVVDYGTWPRQGRTLFSASDMRPGLAELYPALGETERLYAGLTALTDQVLGRTYLRETNAEPVKIERCLIDAGWKPETIYKFIRESKHASVMYPSKGIGRSNTAAGVAAWKPRAGERVGFHWRLTLTETGRGRQVQFDSDEWKTALFDRLTTSPGGRGRLTLFTHEPNKLTADHEMLGQHCAAETAQPYTLPLRGQTFEKWSERPNHPDNHLFDCLTGTLVAASVQGLIWSPSGSATKPLPQKSSVGGPKLSELAAAKRAAS